MLFDTGIGAGHVALVLVDFSDLPDPEPVNAYLIIA